MLHTEHSGTAKVQITSFTILDIHKEPAVTHVIVAFLLAAITAQEFQVHDTDCVHINLNSSVNAGV
jgi:hypothetical protein